jgi:protein-S-isoprenylcysteine O-methyltransferase Ste14
MKMLHQIISQAPAPFNETHVFLWFLVMAIYGFSEIGIAAKNKRLIPKTKHQNKGVLFIVLPFFLTMFVSIFEALQNGHLWNNTLFAVGTIILISGIIVRLSALIQIGKGFSIKIEKNEEQKIIQNGLYKFIRHPLYLASIIQSLGSVIMLRSKWAWLFVPFTVIAVVLRIKQEEVFLAKEFNEYSAYQKNTKKLLPFIY